MRNSTKRSSVSAPWMRKLLSRHTGNMKTQGPNRTIFENTNQQLGYNQSQIHQFLILGGKLWLKDFFTELSAFLLLVYIVILIANSMIFFAVLLLRKLHTPMYIFISNLSLTDIIITTTVLPKIISVGLLNDIAISYSGCFLQQNTYLAFQATQSFLLGVMAFDRYVAICNPLRYNDIITLKICALLSISSWIIGILITFPIVIKSSMLPFCGDKMTFWFCDFPPVIALSCSDTTSLLFQALGLALFAIMIPGYVIIWTYSKIIFTVCKIKSVDGRKKAFSTCSSHLTVVILFYGAHLIVYISSTVNNVRPSVLILISIINCILTPFANPIIYSFRNKELKTAIQKHFRFPRLHPL